MNPIKVLLIVAAFLCIGLGTLGIIIPVLPTVPLYLLALFLFERSSDRLHNWFKGTKLYERYLKNFMEHRSMTLRGKLTILIPVGILLIVTAVLIDSLIARIIIGALIVIMNVYFFTRIKTVSPEEKAAETISELSSPPENLE
jgi:uncharacterized membrane protein YbaN (DUF454 family)